MPTIRNLAHLFFPLLAALAVVLEGCLSHKPWTFALSLTSPCVLPRCDPDSVTWQHCWLLVYYCLTFLPVGWRVSLRNVSETVFPCLVVWAPVHLRLLLLPLPWTHGLLRDPDQAVPSPQNPRLTPGLPGLPCILPPALLTSVSAESEPAQRGWSRWVGSGIPRDPPQ